MINSKDKKLAVRARRAATRAGWFLRKRRGRLGTIDNSGGYMLADAFTNSVFAGERFNLSAQEVIDYCGAHRELRRSLVRLRAPST